MSRASKSKLSVRDQLRIDDLVSVLLDGAIPLLDLPHFVGERQAAGEEPWKEPITGAKLVALIAAAEKRIEKSVQTPRRKLLSRHVAQRKHLYARALAQGDCRVALACLKDEAALQGLYDRQPRRKAKMPTLGTQVSTASVQELLADVQAKLLRGEIDVRTAQTVAALAGVRLKLAGEQQAADEDARLLETTATVEHLDDQADDESER